MNQIINPTKIFKATLKKDLNDIYKKGTVLLLEFIKENKVHILANTKWQWYIDTISEEDITDLFDNICFVKVNNWTKLI